MFSGIQNGMSHQTRSILDQLSRKNAAFTHETNARLNFQVQQLTNTDDFTNGNSAVASLKDLKTTTSYHSISHPRYHFSNLVFECA